MPHPAQPIWGMSDWVPESPSLQGLNLSIVAAPSPDRRVNTRAGNVYHHHCYQPLLLRLQRRFPRRLRRQTDALAADN
jgi:hypothetical protein